MLDTFICMARQNKFISSTINQITIKLCIVNTLTAINYSVFLSIWNVFCNCYYSFLVVDWSWFYLSDKAFVFMIKSQKNSY